jgi:flagellar motor switch protein FliG
MKTLAIALKGSPDSLTERILKNLPARSRQMLTDEISLLATVTKSAIQEAQSAIADLLRQNEEEGKITLD